MPSDDVSDQRLEDLIEEIRRSGNQRKRTPNSETGPSRLLSHMSWFLALATFLVVLGSIRGRMSDQLSSIIIAALVAAIVLFLTQLVISFVMARRKEGQ